MKAFFVAAAATLVSAQDGDGEVASIMSQVMPEKLAFFEELRQKGELPMEGVQDQGFTACSDGKAGEYPCNGMDLMDFKTHSTLGSQTGEGNDCWGWTDPESGKEYALIGQTDGTAFAEVTPEGEIVYLGRVNSTRGVSSTWRDMKVYKDHAFIVSEARGHGIQVFDLKTLRDADPADPQVWEPLTTYTDRRHTSSHNIVINEESGFAYSVGTKTYSGGLHIVDIRDPANPVFAGSYAADRYTHDAQCVNYTGPDQNYVGREICFCYNEDTLTIVDVTDKSAPVQLSRTGYDGAEYTHQGWLLEDNTHVLLNDELDEQRGVPSTRTHMVNVEDLTAPRFIGFFDSSEAAIDHNLYVKDNLVYESNYSAGLRVLNVDNVKDSQMDEVAFFDVYPQHNRNEFVGTWSNYPYFASGNILVNGIETGAFIVKFSDAAEAPESEQDAPEEEAPEEEAPEEEAPEEEAPEEEAPEEEAPEEEAPEEEAPEEEAPEEETPEEEAPEEEEENDAYP